MDYYNDTEEYAGAWLRNLQACGEIPVGVVDGQSIVDVKSADLEKYRRAHFFAGIGGWAQALKMAGWPEGVPVWTGSCPCQPFSVAGKGKGEQDERHLWPVFRDLIRDRRPPVVFGEQVASPAGRKWLAGVRSDLEAMGYRVGSSDLCAAGVSAPHIRQRLYWVADTPGWESGDGEIQRSWKHRLLQEDGRAGDGARGAIGTKEVQPDGMADLEGGRRKQERGAAKEDAGAPAQSGGRRGVRPGGVADADPSRCSVLGARDHEDWDNASRDNSDGRCQAGGVGVSSGPGLEERAGDQDGPGAVRHQGEAVGARGSWSNFYLVPCTDGKTRRVGSGVFPLAHGVPCRVGKLRAYGNAIVPEVAATFIQAYIETFLGNLLRRR